MHKYQSLMEVIRTRCRTTAAQSKLEMSLRHQKQKSEAQLIIWTHFDGLEYRSLQKFTKIFTFSTKHNENEIKIDSEISVLIFSLSKYSNFHHSTDVFDVAHVFRLQSLYKSIQKFTKICKILQKSRLRTKSHNAN